MSQLPAIDPYNYPSLNRKDLMNLSKITARDENIKNIKNRINTKRQISQNLLTTDIEGFIYLIKVIKGLPKFRIRSAMDIQTLTYHIQARK